MSITPAQVAQLKELSKQLDSLQPMAINALKATDILQIVGLGVLGIGKLAHSYPSAVPTVISYSVSTVGFMAVETSVELKVFAYRLLDMTKEYSDLIKNNNMDELRDWYQKIQQIALRAGVTTDKAHKQIMKERLTNYLPFAGRLLSKYFQ